MKCSVHIALAAILVTTSACSVVFQRSKRSSSVYCSNSRFWYGSDIVLGGGMTYVAATKSNDSRALIPGAVFLGSALIGIYKRHNCVRWQETAPPEEWARMAALAEAERVAAAQRAAEWEAARVAAAEEAARQQAMQPPPEQQPQPEPQPMQPQPIASEPQPVAPRPPIASRPVSPQRPPIQIHIERHSATDEIGKACTGSTPDGWPEAGSCQYGAVCYAKRCTVWCGNDSSCPNRMTCAFTDGKVKTMLCR